MTTSARNSLNQERCVWLTSFTLLAHSVVSRSLTRLKYNDRIVWLKKASYLMETRKRKVVMGRNQEKNSPPKTCTQPPDSSNHAPLSTVSPLSNGLFTFWIYQLISQGGKLSHKPLTNLFPWILLVLGTMPLMHNHFWWIFHIQAIHALEIATEVEERRCLT